MTDISTVNDTSAQSASLSTASGPGAPTSTLAGWLTPLTVAAVALVLWTALTATGVLPHQIFPSPVQVAHGFREEIRSNRLFDDIVASLWRVTIGVLLAAMTGMPLGLWMGRRKLVRQALMPGINFFRSLSPIAWLGFAITWFGIGDNPAIFLIFLSAFFPIVVATEAAVTTIPQVYFRVAQEYGLTGLEALRLVTFPAILPQLITTMRVTMGIAWVVVVAAEMVVGSRGLGYDIQDDRNILRPDLLVVHMIVIGIIGALIDRWFLRLTRLESIRWSYDK